MSKCPTIVALPPPRSEALKLTNAYILISQVSTLDNDNETFAKWFSD